MRIVSRLTDKFARVFDTMKAEDLFALVAMVILLAAWCLYKVVVVIYTLAQGAM